MYHHAWLKHFLNSLAGFIKVTCSHCKNSSLVEKNIKESETDSPPPAAAQLGYGDSPSRCQLCHADPRGWVVLCPERGLVNPESIFIPTIFSKVSISEGRSHGLSWLHSLYVTLPAWTPSFLSPLLMVSVVRHTYPCVLGRMINHLLFIAFN
jgi:hypothetical protein